MTATEVSAQQAIIGAIEGIASTLGFLDSTGNVHDYPLDLEDPSQYAKYLMADTSDSDKALRAWYVDVLPNDDFETHTSTTIFMTLVVGAYYERGIGGAGVNLLREHVRLVRQAIRALETNLGGAVSHIIEMSKTEFGLVETETGGNQGQMLTVQWSYEAEKAGGTYT